MKRKITVHFITGESKQVNDPLGGLVANGRTNEVISQIGPDVEEIIVLDMIIGGG